MKLQSILMWILAALFSVFLFGLQWGLVFTVIARIAGLWLLSGHTLKGALMAVVAYAPCVEVLPAHAPAGECIDEGSGVLGMFLVKKGFNISSAITDQITYDAALTAKDIIPIKDLEAYWPGPSQQVIPGIAGRIERHGHWLFDMPFKHEGVDANLLFWNNITNKRNYGVAFITEEYKAFCPLDRQLEPVICAISAAPNSDQEFGKTRFIQGNVKWKQKDLVYHLDNLTVAMLKVTFQV